MITWPSKRSMGAYTSCNQLIKSPSCLTLRRWGDPGPRRPPLVGSDAGAWRALASPPEFNPLIQQDVVFFPSSEAISESTRHKESTVSSSTSFALGLIETQGFTAVFEAIDSACKAANVDVIGKEKLGGGYVTVIIKGDVAAVTAAVEAGKCKVEGLGKLIAAHVIARPSDAALSLLPKG